MTPHADAREIHVRILRGHLLEHRDVIIAARALAADFAYDFVVYGNLLTSSFVAQAGVYRTAAAQMAYMPFGAAGIFVAMIGAVLLFARGNYRAGAAGGVVFGLLLALFAIGAAVVVNYATLNISGDHAAKMIAAAFGEWLLVGTVIGAAYGAGPRPGTR